MRSRLLNVQRRVCRHIKYARMRAFTTHILPYKDRYGKIRVRENPYSHNILCSGISSINSFREFLAMAVNVFQSLSVVTKSSILDIAENPDPLLLKYQEDTTHKEQIRFI